MKNECFFLSIKLTVKKTTNEDKNKTKYKKNSKAIL